MVREEKFILKVMVLFSDFAALYFVMVEIHDEIHLKFT